MEVVILGSGTCALTAKRAAAGYLVKIGKTKILLDCGNGTAYQLIKAREDYKDIDVVVLSHFHPDHAGDLAFIIQAIENTPGFKRKKPLYILGPKRVKKFVENLMQLFGLGLITSRAYGLKTCGLNEERKILGISFKAIKGNHTKQSAVIKINFKDKALVYSGDTDWNRRITTFSQGVDLLILEASYPNEYEDKKEIRKKHLTPKMAAKLGKMARAKKLLLTHFYPLYQKGQINKEAARGGFKGELLIAEDLMRIRI